MPKTITDALNTQPIYFLGGEDRLTSVRIVPYAERYRAATSLLETPEERLQRAALLAGLDRQDDVVYRTAQ